MRESCKRIFSTLAHQPLLALATFLLVGYGSIRAMVSAARLAFSSTGRHRRSWLRRRFLMRGHVQLDGQLETEPEPPAPPTPAPPGRVLKRPLQQQHRQRQSGISRAANWAVPGESQKTGVGVLFFAYGGAAQLSTFLSESTVAARSIKRYNPKLAIGVVTNNGTVDTSVFTHLIPVRPDLLFATASSSSVSQEFHATSAREHLAKQWTTRIFHMALSPFRITWALDSNVFQCPGAFAVDAVHRFLLAAEASKPRLWGVDLAHANQDAHGKLWPHNFNMIYAWNPRTSNLMRDWFMLQLRRGVGTDDQRTLLLAERRQQRVRVDDADGCGDVKRDDGRPERRHHPGNQSRDRKPCPGLRVGQIPTEFATAFYSPWMKEGHFLPRVTRTLTGPSQLVHTTASGGPLWCASLNAARGVKRQLAQIGTRIQGSVFTPLFNDSVCKHVLGLPDIRWPRVWWPQGRDEWERQCPFASGGMEHPRSDGELLSAFLATLPEKDDW